MRKKKLGLSLWSTRKLFAKLDDLEKERVRLLSDLEPQKAEEAVRGVDEEEAPIKEEIAKRMRTTKDHFLSERIRNFGRAALKSLKLDEKRIEWVRELPDVHVHSLGEARAARGLPPLPAQMETGSLATRTEAVSVRRVSTPPPVKLTEREERVFAIIQRGTKGRAYCRELDNAQIAPRRDGIWKDGPRKYLAAYNLGNPWVHRIEDEKAKIRRKATKLAGALARE